ncbi:TonB-dependent receptor domain-containing protein [Halarcobacter ebronensis]|uniref:TonB-dependent siderophore receptor n=1 Tax=Halarcobacter ebronensis TaxID=1462615 RepID=A0A4Q1AQ48_9BACT|nr:TonB-dependent receptor [Halarcobacter ebronensis]QKF82597.1 TonB-dependent receptor [Halarcobacter ebronensis]RXK07392.1 TonB-dependent siderophore receptor [Halarcobacter ebronensis]
MDKSRVLLSAITSFAIFSTHILADEAVKNVESVDVWDTQIISSSLNLGENSIETKQADHLSDLLRDLPGVDVGGTHSINNRINIRGLQDENLDITLDGAKIQNANMFHHIGNLLINPDILKRANIQVGTNSVVNGSLGGSVAFETKDGKDMLTDGKNYGARISTTYESNDSLGGSLSAYGKVFENADFLIYHNYLNKNNWKDGNGTETFGVDGEVNNTLIKFGVNLTDNQRLSLSYDTLKDEGDYAPRPDFGREYNEARTGLDTFPTEYTRETIILKHELDLDDKLFLTTSIYSNENELERYEGPLSSGSRVRPPAGLPAGTSSFEGMLIGKVKTEGINSKAQSFVETGSISHRFTYGGLYDKQTSKVTWEGKKYGDDEEAKSLAFYIEDAIDFNNGLIVTPGIRYNNYDFDGSYGKMDDSEVTYGLATEYSVNEDLTLFASATTLFKGVEMVDVLASNRAVVADNTNLKSETGINKEIGFKYIKNNILGADTIGVSFTYFNTTIDDYIFQDSSAMSNMGELDIKGFEANFAYNKGNLNSLLTYAHSSSNFERTGEPLIEEPGDSISLGIDYKLTPRLDISWESLFVLKEDDVPSGAYQEKKAYDVHDIALKWRPESVKDLTVIAGVENIFDKAYSSHISENRYFAGYGYTTDYEPGRNFKITLAYKF